MKKKICAFSLLNVAAIVLFFINPIHAVDLEFQPRLETGALYYSFEVGAFGKTVLSRPGDPSGHNETKEKSEFSDTMSFVGWGVTLFINRLFVDLSGQYAFDGSDRTTVSESQYTEQTENNTGQLVASMLEYQGQFDRTDHAVCVGYAVTKRFSVFAGFKWTENDLDRTFEGPFSWLYIEDRVGNGRIRGEEVFKFKYEGPFIGVVHGWPVDRFSIFEGLISVNAGLAHLNSKLNEEENGTWRYDSVNGQPIEPFVGTFSETRESKGDTLGLTLGLNWQGMTWIKNLSYSVGISGYRYQFDSDDSDQPDISETAVTYKVGLAYAF